MRRWSLPPGPYEPVVHLEHLEHLERAFLMHAAQAAAAAAAPSSAAKPKRAAQITKSYEESRWEDMQQETAQH